MSRGARLSVLGLYKADSGLFSEMVYPSGFTSDEKQTTVGNILSECAELECLFPDPDTMKTMIGLWSKLNISVWERIFTASQLEYNPIENYNRTELETISDDRSDTHSGNDVNKLTGTDTRLLDNTQTHSGSDTHTLSETHSGTDTHTISETHSGTDTHTTSETHSGTDTHTTSETHSGTDTHTTSETHSGTDTTTNSITAYDANTQYVHDTSALLHGHGISGSDALAHGESISGSDALAHGHSISGSDALAHGESISGSDALAHGESISGSDALAHGHKIIDDGSDSITYGKTETLTHGEKIVHEGDITKNSHISGNIGVTTSQQMLEQEIEISAKLNVIKMIVDSFKERFCLLVY